MKKTRTLVEAASFALFRKYLPILFLAATLAASVPLFAFGDKYQIESLRVVGGIIFITGLWASVFTSREIVFRMEDDPGMLFSDALMHSVYRYLTVLCFIPIVGPLLQDALKKKQARNPFTDDEK
jgi:hypothetical protein